MEAWRLCRDAAAAGSLNLQLLYLSAGAGGHLPYLTEKKSKATVMSWLYSSAPVAVDVTVNFHKILSVNLKYHPCNLHLSNIKQPF